MALLLLSSLLPFWCGPLLLGVDLPQHLAIAAIAAAPELHEAYYDIDLGIRPYALATHLLVGLGALLPLEVALRVLLSAYALSLVLAVRALVRAVPERDPRLSWFGPLFVHGWPAAYGFLPFLLALPPMLFALARARRALDQSNARDGLALAGYSLLTLLFHPLVAAWGLALLAAVVGRKKLKLLAWALLGPSLVFGLARMRPETFSGVRLGDEAIGDWWRLRIKHKLLEYAVAYLPGDLDHLVAAPGALALVAWLLLGLRQSSRPFSEPLERAGLMGLLLYLVAPADLTLGSARISLLGPRLVVPLWLLSVALPRPIEARASQALAGLGGLSALLFHILVATHTLSFGRRWNPQLERALSKVTAGARVLPVVSEPAEPALNPRLFSPAEGALHAYAIVRAGAAYDPLLFSTAQSPVRTLASAPTASERLAFDFEWVQTATGTLTLRRLK